MNNCRIFFLSFWLLSISTSSWAAIGLPENTMRYGAALSVANMKITEPDGRTPNRETMTPFTLIATDWLAYGNGNRYWIEYVNGSTSYSASEEVVGQNLNYSALRVIIQRHLNLGKHIKPWFGVGLSISRSTFRIRHTKTDDGFLKQQFDDRTSNRLGLIFNAAIDYQVEKKWFLGIKAEQTFNPSVSVNTLGAGIFLLHLL